MKTRPTSIVPWAKAARIARGLALAFGMASVSLLFAQSPLHRPELETKTYASPSCEWSLRIEPKDRSGAGAANYVMTQQGKLAWRKTHPFALWEACVSDEGEVVGYAHSRADPSALTGGSLRVVILTSRGEVRLDEPHERGADPHPDAYQPIPVGSGVFILAAPKRLVVRVQSVPGSEAAEEWWIYDLATGKALAHEDPRKLLHADGTMPFILSASAVPGIPLVLIQWWRADFDQDPYQAGGVFQLVDTDWQVVWTMTRPVDYSPPDRRAREALWEEIRAHGAVIEVAAQRFVLRFVSDNERVTFGVEPNEEARSGQGWTVTELSRAPYP